ncbi:MAG TPA: hypothetical protein VMP10_02500 [Chloroflexota bacterium]|nr:hypothetical protein [Chloroflexota bacterium]
MTVEQIVDRKAEDYGWGAIALDLGLHPSILGKGGKGASSAAKGGPPAHAKAGKPEAAK